ncbi:hypothetical protein [Hydrogenimonas sp.]
MFYRNLIAGLWLLFATSLAMANDSQRHQVVGDTIVYLGIIPAQLVRDHPGMHGVETSKAQSYHILVALFDRRSGTRISDAKVKATVSFPGRKKMTRELEPMRGEPISYGNYFVMKEPGTYRIRIEMERKDGGGTSVANFEFQRPAE